MAVSIMKVLDLGIFPLKILFCVNFTYDEIIGELKKQKCDGWMKGIENDKELVDGSEYLAMFRHFSISKKEYHHYYIVLKNPFKYTDAEMCRLAHECLHICQYALYDMVDPRREHECIAYTHTYLMSQCLETMRGADRRSKSKKRKR